MSNETASAVRYWNKSEEVRIIAESMTNKETKQFMMSVAADYQIVAESLERLLRSGPR